MPKIPKESSKARATQDTCRTSFLIASTPLEWRRARMVTTDPCPCSL
jgi:hypothetical protein